MQAIYCDTQPAGKHQSHISRLDATGIRRERQFPHVNKKLREIPVITLILPPGISCAIPRGHQPSAPVVAALDYRYHWSSATVWVIIIGYVLFTAGMVGCFWVLSVNKFAEMSVRIQTDRGHKVIDTGPYAVVRHPMYVACFLLFPGIALALGSLWALIPAALVSVVLVVRTVFEDRTLQEQLDGYREYACRVRYRLIPGVW